MPSFFHFVHFKSVQCSLLFFQCSVSIVWSWRCSSHYAYHLNAIQLTSFFCFICRLLPCVHDVIQVAPILFYNSARFLIKFRYCDCINWSLRFFNGFCMHLPSSSNLDSSRDYIQNADICVGLLKRRRKRRSNSNRQLAEIFLEFLLRFHLWLNRIKASVFTAIFT